VGGLALERESDFLSGDWLSIEFVHNSDPSRGSRIFGSMMNLAMWRFGLLGHRAWTEPRERQRLLDS
jgi:hypothetical protein